MKKIIVVLGLVLGVGLLIFLKITSRSSKSPTSSKLPMYYSCQFGYGVGLPTGWVVNDRDFATNQEIILVDKTKAALVKINASKDSKINSLKSVEEAIAKIKAQMQSDPNIKLASFKDLSEDQVGGYLATGEQIVDKVNYIFQSQGLIHTNGRLLQFHGAIKTEAKDNYSKSLISDIVTSFVINKELACKNSSK